MRGEVLMENFDHGRAVAEKIRRDPTHLAVVSADVAATAEFKDGFWSVLRRKPRFWGIALGDGPGRFVYC